MIWLSLLTLCYGGDPAHHQHGASGHGESGQHAAAGHGDQATIKHRFEDADRWSKVFDDPARDAWQKPAVVVALLDLKPGMVVADIGAGTGHFNGPLAAAVGAKGQMIAIDIEPTLIAHMTERATAEKTPWVHPRLATADDPKLGPAEVDRVLLVDVYHHIDGRTAYFSALRDALRPGGRLVVVDFKEGELPVGPPPEHRIPKAKVISELKAAGWTLVAETPDLPYQFGLAFSPG